MIANRYSRASQAGMSGSGRAASWHMNTPWVVGVTRPREAQSGRPHPAGSESFTRREGAVLGQNQKFGKYTTLINASAKSPTSVNALAGNGVVHPVPERMVGKPNPLIVGRLQMLSREEMSIQIRLTGQIGEAVPESFRGVAVCLLLLALGDQATKRTSRANA